MNFLLFIITLVIDVGCSQFSPRTSDYDSYGLKITGNDKMMIEALGDAQIFLVRYAPYNSTSQSLQCAITYNDSTKYVYSIGIGRKQNFNQSYFFYAGEIISKNSPDYGSPFIGILRNTDIKHAQIYEDTQTLFNCSHFQYQSLQIISSYEHQEFFVFAVEPYGQYAIGLSQDFVYIYRPFSYNKITIKKSGEVWPTDTIFIPFAVDMDSSFTIVAGFVINGPLFRVRGTPTVYVISNSDLTVLSTWSYTAVLNSWQSRLTYSNLKKWSSKYIMSVSINGDDPSQVLIGMPFLNIAFLLNVNLNGSNITMNSYIDNGDSIGFGKSVVWLSKSQAAILSSNSPKNDSSKIYLYDSFNKTTLPPSPDFVFPNIQQSLPSTINARFIRMISIGNSLAILGIDSEILMILSTPPGYFPSTSLSTSESIFVVSESIKCMSGTYKSDNSIFPCSLCPSGSRNLGNLSAISCITCSSDSFCPMGSVFDIERDYLVSRSQAYVHPRSPEVTIFDEILLQNMFSTGSRINCLSVSPIFWVLIVAALVLIILSVMGIIKRCVQHPLGHKVRRHVKRIFRQTDLLNEGEMWIGGLLSVAAVVLFIFAYTFSAAFYKEYPNENAASPTSTCGGTIRNVKYESGLQSLSIPISHEERPIFDLLDQQQFILRLDLLNTVASCQSLSAHQIIGSSTVSLISNCTYSKGILSAAVRLPYRKMKIKWILNDIALIGAVRINISADGKENKLHQLKRLDFSETFYDRYNRTLAQRTTINLELTKAINETEPLTGHESKFSGIWNPTFTVDENHMFISSEDYAISTNHASTKLTVVISETSYYIKNRQLPIAKQGEIIFHNLLFTIVCLEIFRLLILLFKLMIDPLLRLIIAYFQKKTDVLPIKLENVDHDTMTDDDQDITTDTHNTTTTDHSIIPLDI